MSNRGRTKRLDEYIEIRVEASEKKTFKDAANLAGIPLAAWIRERLRRAAVKELEEAAIPVAFLKE